MFYDAPTIAKLCATEDRLAFDPDTPDACIDDARHQIEATRTAVWTDPPTSFADIVSRALLAKQSLDRDPATGGLEWLSSPFAQERAAAELIEAVLVIARRKGLVG